MTETNTTPTKQEIIPAKVLWKAEILTESIKVEEVQKSNRAIDSELEFKLKSEWDEKCSKAIQEGKRELYDGTSFRLEEIIFENGILTLKVSEYKFSIRSTLKKHTEELSKLGESYYSNGLSVSGFLKTADGKYVFAQKSSKGLHSSLKIDNIGGVLEKIDPISGEGILNMNKTEIEEELGVGNGYIKSMKIVGIVRSPTTDIEIITFTQLSISSEELRNFFDKREDKELDNFILVEQEDLNRFLNELGGYKPAMIELLSL